MNRKALYLCNTIQGNQRQKMPFFDIKSKKHSRIGLIGRLINNI